MANVYLSCYYFSSSSSATTSLVVAVLLLVAAVVSQMYYCLEGYYLIQLTLTSDPLSRVVLSMLVVGGGSLHCFTCKLNFNFFYCLYFINCHEQTFIGPTHTDPTHILRIVQTKTQLGSKVSSRT